MFKFTIINKLIFVAIGFVICLLLWRPWETLITPAVLKPVEQIKQEIKEAVVPAEAKADSFNTVIRLLVKDNTTMEKNLWAAWKENERLKTKLSQQGEAAVVISNGTAADFTEVLQAATNSDSLCREVVGNLHQQIDAKDSVIFQKTVSNMALQKGFDDMVQNSMQKDAAMKQLNKKLKWQKVQAWGFKGVAAAAVIFIIKNNLK